jgi:hypothetical protein
MALNLVYQYHFDGALGIVSAVQCVPVSNAPDQASLAKNLTIAPSASGGGNFILWPELYRHGEVIWIYRDQVQAKLRLLETIYRGNVGLPRLRRTCSRL